MLKRVLLLSAFVAGSMAMGAAHAAKVKVVNKTSVTIVGVYASEPSTTDWEENLLDGDTLKPGESFVIDFETSGGSCKWDFLGKFKDGDEAINKGVNVCNTSSFEFTE